MTILNRIAALSPTDQAEPSATAHSRHIVLNGKRHHYLEWGDPQAPTIVFLHGGGLTARTWDDVCSALSTDYRCIAVDLRGHGDSEWSYEFEYEIEHYVSDLQLLVDTLQLDCFALVGMSLGGIVGMTYAVRHAERLAALALIDVIPSAETEKAFRMLQYFNDLEKAVESASSFSQVLSWAVARSPHKPPRTLRKTLSRNIRELPDGTLMLKRDTRRSYCIDTTVAALHAIPGKADRITCPSLIVKGGRSRAFTTEAGARFAEKLPNARMVEIEGAGHAIQEDEPEALVEVLREFLGGISPPYSRPNALPS